METGWGPANEVEREIAEALTTGDGKRFANAVITSPLYLPVLPEQGSERWRELSAQLPLDQPHVLVFTSTDAMSLLLGSYTRGHIETDYTSLVRSWPGPQFQLAINPGLPIGSVMPVEALEQLRTGKEELIPAEALSSLVEERVTKRMRELCLAGLGLGVGVLPAAAPPANELEEALDKASAEADGEAFLAALWESDVVVPTSEEVEEIVLDPEVGFPWLDFEDAVPVFTSQEQLERTSNSVEFSAVVPFLALLALWPDAHHTLCLNPGAPTELILSGETLLSILIEMDQLPPEPDQPDAPIPPLSHDRPDVDDHITPPHDLL
ncbi:SseB family protein [Allokutzneria sp. NRRL B-24872]|uniref:SseB family protein n=1 Tax=Allokutzneria sp. NRRL B-24872 TaxID=1137961 RepID=UPI000A37B493|nr:SseB family protein [Allokutzneria sp. NRRL B-24872]